MIGLVAVIFTDGTAKFIFWLIAIWVLLVGILQIIASVIRYRAQGRGLDCGCSRPGWSRS